MKYSLIAVPLLVLGLSGCSYTPSLEDVGSFFGIDTDAEAAIAVREECAALDMAIAANLSSSVNAKKEEQAYADAFRKQSGRTLDEAVQLRMDDEGSDRKTAYRTSSRRVRQLTRQRAVEMNDRVIADETGILDNNWVNDQRLDCQEALS